MDGDPVLVPPEVFDGLQSIDESGDLRPDDRAEAKQAARERGLDDTVNWLERVGDEVYERAALGDYETEGGD